MGQRIQVNENEKNLLTVLGRHLGMSLKEFTNCTPHKWVSTVAKKVEQFKKQNILHELFCAEYFIRTGIII